MKIIPFRRRPTPRRMYNLVPILIGVHVTVFLAVQFIPFLGGLLALSTVAIHPWQAITYPFVDVMSSLWGLVFDMMALFFFGTQVEQELGSLEFLAMYLGLPAVTALIAWMSGAAFGLSGVQLFGAAGVVSGILLAWASFHPWQTIHLFGIFPIRAPVLMLIMGGLMVLGMLSGGLSQGFHFVTLLLAWLYMIIRHRRNFAESLLSRRN